MRLARRIWVALLAGPLARLRIRVWALRLALRPISPSKIRRDERLADAVKAASGGRCAACGSIGIVEADHRRPRWSGGADAEWNLWALCTRCHDAKTEIERKIRERFVRRARFRNGAGAWNPTGIMPLHRWTLAALVLLGAVDGAFGLLAWWPWRIGAIIIFAAGWWWQRHKKGRIAGEDGMVRFDADDERSRYANSLAGDHVAVTQRIKVVKLRTRAAMLWYPGAYLASLAIVLILL